MTRWLQTVIATAILSFVLLVSFAGGADPPVPLTQEQRTDIEHRLRGLEELLASARPIAAADNQALDRWADVDVFRKGLRWALRYDTTFTPDDVKLLLKAVCRNYSIDRNRIVLRGMSMGASGTWHLGLIECLDRQSARFRTAAADVDSR